MKKILNILIIFLLTSSTLIGCKDDKKSTEIPKQEVKSEELKFGLTKNERKQLFKDIVSAEDNANKFKRTEEDKALELKMSKGNLKIEYDRIDKETEKLMNKYKLKVLKKYNITEEQERKISKEAFEKNWPLD